MGRLILPDDPENPFGDVEKQEKREMISAGLPKNDQSLAAVEIIGRCGVCSITGTIEYPRNLIPATDIDKLLAYKPVKCFCPKCKKNTEFLPVDVNKYPDVPALGKIQEGFKKGIVR